MNSTDRNDPIRLWNRYRQHLCSLPELGFTLDISRMDFDDGFFGVMQPAMEKAFDAMQELEKGGIANPDEGRMVGHYWLRNPDRAPSAEIGRQIRETIDRIKHFADGVHRGEILSESDSVFRNILIAGIGGSALGPQFVSDALGSNEDKMRTFFCDNSDPDGYDRTFSRLDGELGATLTLVVSKSGGTKETRNAALEIAEAYRRAGLSFPRAAVAVTGDGSALDRRAKDEDWLASFPMWDWVGGRTSEFSAVGLLPAALQGIDVDEMLLGARRMDAATALRDVPLNPAALLALMWHHAGGGRGRKDMVILPYKDRLLLFSKYLQQLVMESLGKEEDLAGNVVNQGIAVYGNKGSTDQHAYVQQLRDGLNNFFVTFIEILKDRERPGIEVEPGVTSGDYLHGFLRGTRRALYENGRESMTITLPDVSPRSIGMLIALFERAVGLYASLVNVNAYHQPGVEAGKRAAEGVIELQKKIKASLAEGAALARTAEEIAGVIGESAVIEDVFKILEHLSANKGSGVEKTPGPTPFEATYRRGASSRSAQ